LDAVRDWGYAPEYVEGMWQMLQTSEPEDFVLATGVPATVRDFLDWVFSAAGLKWQDYVKFDEKYTRPTEVDSLIGSSQKAREKLNWSASVVAEELAQLMFEADVKVLEYNTETWIDKPIFRI
jgi:GDPmannose 4,6-dehydratase